MLRDKGYAATPLNLFFGLAQEALELERKTGMNLSHLDLDHSPGKTTR
jgi:hypothetical protein